MKDLLFTFIFVTAAAVQITAQIDDFSKPGRVESRASALVYVEPAALQGDVRPKPVRMDFDRSFATKNPGSYLEKSGGIPRFKNPSKLHDFSSPDQPEAEPFTKEPSGVLPAVPKQNNYVRPTAKERFDRYRNSIIGTGLISVGFGAVLKQISNEPEEWKRTTGGFGRRLASGFGQKVIKETVAYGIEEGLKLDSRFYPSPKKDLGSRIKHGLSSGFAARTPEGKRVFNPGPIVGSYISSVVSREVWYPERYTYKDGLRSATRGLVFTALFGLVREFVFN